MSVEVPGLGQISGETAPTGIATSDYFDSDERPEFVARQDGLAVVLARIPGLTRKDVLKTKYTFTVPPLNSFSRTRSHSHQEYDTIGAGQFSRPGGKELVSIQFETMAIAYRPQWGLVPVDSDWAPNPRLLSWELEEICDSGTPFIFTAFDPLYPAKNEFRMMATLRSVTVDMRAGEDDARYLDVAFREFRDPTIVERGRTKTKGHTHRLPTTVVVQASGVAYEVTSAGKRGATIVTKPITLAGLAKHFYGSSAQWRKIVAVNGHLRDWPQNGSLAALGERRYKNRLPKIKIPKLGGG